MLPVFLFSSTRHRWLSLGAHEFDDIAKLGGIAGICVCKRHMAFQAEFGALLLAARCCGQSGAWRGGSGLGQMFLIVVDCENFIEAEAAEELSIPAGGVNNVKYAPCCIKSSGNAGEGAHKCAVHASTRREVNDYPLTSRGLHLSLHKGFQFTAVLMAALAFNSHPYTTIYAACEYA